jgi:hypothetical protein
MVPATGPEESFGKLTKRKRRTSKTADETSHSVEVLEVDDEMSVVTSLQAYIRRTPVRALLLAFGVGVVVASLSRE